jgi:hypothetical protein
MSLLQAHFADTATGHLQSCSVETVLAHQTVYVKDFDMRVGSSLGHSQASLVQHPWAGLESKAEVARRICRVSTALRKDGAHALSRIHSEGPANPASAESTPIAHLQNRAADLLPAMGHYDGIMQKVLEVTECICKGSAHLRGANRDLHYAGEATPTFPNLSGRYGCPGGGSPRSCGSTSS